MPKTQLIMKYYHHIIWEILKLMGKKIPTEVYFSFDIPLLASGLKAEISGLDTGVEYSVSLGEFIAYLQDPPEPEPEPETPLDLHNWRTIYDFSINYASTTGISIRTREELNSAGWSVFSEALVFNGVEQATAYEWSELSDDYGAFIWWSSDEGYVTVILTAEGGYGRVRMNIKPNNTTDGKSNYVGSLYISIGGTVVQSWNATLTSTVGRTMETFEFDYNDGDELRFMENRLAGGFAIYSIETYTFIEPEPEPEPQPEPEPELDIVSALIWGTNGDSSGNMLVDKVGNVNIPINGGESIAGLNDTYGYYVSLSQRIDNYYAINNPSFRTLVTNNGNKATFSYIFRNTNNSGIGPVFSINDGSWEIYMAHSNSDSIFYNFNGTTGIITSSGPIADNVWVTMTITYDGSTWNIYENTTLMVSVTKSFNFAGEFNIGRQNSYGGFAPEGDLASFFIANEVIDLSKIGDLCLFTNWLFQPEPEPEPEGPTIPQVLFVNPEDFGNMSGNAISGNIDIEYVCFYTF